MGKNGVEEQACLDCVFRTGVYIWSDSDSECDIIEQALKSAKPNDVWNAFPDFICDNGFIEHFEVTSTKQTGKGSKMRVQRCSMNQEMNRFRAKMIDAQMQLVPGAVYSKSVQRKTETATHEFLLLSLKRQWEEHLKKFVSYVKKAGQQDFSAFMVDLRYENLLFMIEEIPVEIRRAENLQFVRQPYWPLADALLLRRLAEYADEVKYVIFVKQGRCDVVPVSMLGRIADELVYSFHIYACSGIVWDYGTCVRMPWGEDD